MRKLANLPGWWMMNRNAHKRRRVSAVGAPGAPTVSGTWINNDGLAVVGVTLPALPYLATSFRVERQANGGGDWVDVSADFGMLVSWSYAEYVSEAEVSYRWRCIAVGAHGESAPGAESERVVFAPSIEGVGAPSVSGTSIDPADETGITVSMPEMPAGVSFMRLERRWEEGEWEDISGRLDEGQYNQAGTEPATEGTYEWRAVAGNAGGEVTSESVAASVFDPNATLEAPKPDVNPTALDGDASATTAVTFNLPNGATGWELQQSADGGDWETVATGDGNNCGADCSFDNRNGENSVFVRYHVKWSDRFGRESEFGAESDAVEFYPVGNPPPPPGPPKPDAPGVSATELTANGSDSVTVTMPDLTEGAVRFRVQRSVNGGDWEDCTGDFGSEPGSGATAEYSSSEDVSFSWRCIALDGDGNGSEASDASETVNFHGEEPPPPPSGPGKPDAPGVSETSVPANGSDYSTVTLPGLPDGAVRFRVERSANGGEWLDCTGDFGSEPGSGATSDCSSTEEDSFAWRCVAIDGDNNESEASDPSETVNFIAEE